MNTIIIAEAGVNHNGNLDIAFRLIEAAKESGADYIKFQTFSASDIVTHSACQAEYQIKNIGQRESQLEMLKRLELPYSMFEKLNSHCKRIGIKFLSSCFHQKDIEVLKKIQMDYVKIPSGEITNLPLIESAAKYSSDTKIILSTGMSTLGEIEETLNLIISNGVSRENIYLLHCTTEYPAPLNSVNLKSMITLKKAFGCKVGYSDHTSGIEVSIAAVAMGAMVVEKHFTLDKKMAGPDHKASLEPVEFKRMVKAIRNIEIAKGVPTKSITFAEEKNRLIVRKSLVALRSIKSGEVFTKENLGCKRPGQGISPMNIYKFLGIKSTKDYKKNDFIEWQ